MIAQGETGRCRMDLVPRMAAISEFCSHQSELLERVSTEPVLLTQHGHSVAGLLGAEYGARPVVPEQTPAL
jgi:hypothetical protein